MCDFFFFDNKSMCDRKDKTLFLVLCYQCTKRKVASLVIVWFLRGKIRIILVLVRKEANNSNNNINKSLLLISPSYI